MTVYSPPGRSCESSTATRPPPLVERSTASSALPSVTARDTSTCGYGTDSSCGPSSHSCGMPFSIMSSQPALRPTSARESATCEDSEASSTTSQPRSSIFMSMRSLTSSQAASAAGSSPASRASSMM